jgi:hypothetical protein
MTNTEIAETYFEAYRSRDLTKALLAPDVTMQHAVTPRKLLGKDTVIDYMLALMSGLDDLTIERHVVEGEFVARCGRPTRCGVGCRCVRSFGFPVG